MKTFSQLREASVDRSKRNPTRDFLRKYPVSDAEMAKPITYYSLVHKATNKVLSTHRDLESAKDEHRGMDQGERAHYRIATSTKAPKSFSMKEDAEGVAEGLGKNVVKSVKVGNFRHDLVDTGMGWQVRIYNGDELHDTGLSKNSEHKGLAALEDAVAHTEKQTRTKRQGVAEAAFKDPSPMMKDSIKQDKIRSLKNLIAIAKVKGAQHKVKEYESELKKLQEASVFPYTKPPRKGSVAYNALMKRKEQDKKRVKEIEAIGTKNHHVGVAKVVTKEDVEDVTEASDADKYSYIDQTKGPILKGKTGTFVGYTHSTSKGKGANILKHNKTGKYYAAGGSSTAFTQKTTLHDTPEAAAKAYHKGNLAEASPMIKPPKNEFGKKEEAFAHAKQHGGKVMKKTFTHPTSGMQTVSYVVKKD